MLCGVGNRHNFRFNVTFLVANVSPMLHAQVGHPPCAAPMPPALMPSRGRSGVANSNAIHQLGAPMKSPVVKRSAVNHHSSLTTSVT